ncbi:DUF1653 domain-containing protein (plasmid) [Paenibacillus rhizovicinus]|uniref:DUF1653 domain-containing protein n=1 Tax=Paenibacillus rhizovicinus TaxID=2704463 RepID=A0A6C0PB27_9BACL|nr:DUF1653 domain-containing protein [Paenibacillus rhizovicinus]QHW35689.1 DUF1653 domain-containing protein [Paenibacillus rhizovicinus]
MKPTANENYKHYKGGIYKVIGVGSYMEGGDKELMKGCRQIGIGKYSEGKNEKLAVWKEGEDHFWITPQHIIGSLPAMRKLKGEDLVIYVNDEGDIWVRPLDMWNESVEVNGETLPRFERLEVAHGARTPVFGAASGRSAVSKRQRI